jgi:hypothetical protein
MPLRFAQDDNRSFPPPTRPATVQPPIPFATNALVVDASTDIAWQAAREWPLTAGVEVDCDPTAQAVAIKGLDAGPDGELRPVRTVVLTLIEQTD